MADLDDLLDALAKVHKAYKGDLDPNDNPDDSENDPNDDPGNDDGDPNDDPRSYPDDEDDDGTGGYYPDDEEEDDEEEDDFSKPKVFNTVMFLERKLETEAHAKAYNDRKLAAVRAGVMGARTGAAKPITKAEQNDNKLFEMRIKTAKAERELKTVRMLEAQSNRLEQVSLELYQANMTDKKRKERDENTRVMARWAAGICPEASPDWRSQAQAAFDGKKI